MDEVNQTEILYAAAHADFPDTEPLGGGKAVADFLRREHRDWTVLSPRSLRLPLEKSLADLSEFQYARFCRQFERAATDAILQRDPRRCVVLVNDISEGPDFQRLGERGYRVATIFHVDVVEYFTKFYLHGFVKPEWLTRLRWHSRYVPDLFRLVFTKQEDCVRHSRKLILPSEPMRDVVLRCYPWCPKEKIAVIPWGNLAAAFPPEPLMVDEDEFVIVTLSRLSPEKGIERLLFAVRHLDTTRRKYRVYICGAAAYMKGRAYERKLRRLASQTPVPVTFVGHVSGGRKAGFLQRADLFVSPSRHESYGLTIAEAMAHGCRVISHGHYGARGVVVDCGDTRGLAGEIEAVALQGRMPRECHTVLSDAGTRVADVLLAMAKS